MKNAIKVQGKRRIFINKRKDEEARPDGMGA